VIAHIRPCRRGVLLGLAEVYQAQDRVKEAIDCLKQLRRDAPDDVVAKLSVAELVLDAAPGDKRLAKQVVELAGNVDNESSAHAALMLYKAQALRMLGLEEGPQRGAAAGHPLRAGLRLRRPGPEGSRPPRVREALRGRPVLRGRGRAAGPLSRAPSHLRRE